MEHTDLYDFLVTDATGNTIPLRKYVGKSLLIVNVSSKDPSAKEHFKKLYLLNAAYRNRGLEILLFHCCQFGEQESINDVIDIMHNNNLQFGTLFQTVDVNGNRCCDMYKFLKKRQPGFMNGFISGNFTSFLVNRLGKTANRINPKSNIDYMKDQIELVLDAP